MTERTEKLGQITFPTNVSWLCYPSLELSFLPGYAAWPGQFRPVACVNSIDLDEIYSSCQRGQQVGEEKVHWLDDDARSMSVGDVIVVQYFDVWMCDRTRWTQLQSNRPRIRGQVEMHRD